MKLRREEHGVHHCLGAPLARAEAAVALRLLLERHPGLALDAGPESLTWRAGTLLRGLTALPVRLGPHTPPPGPPGADPEGSPIRP
ncbi:hypothetical protein GCM10018789_49650 [Streptomyces werraensis]|nr:hypothetical protein GCM10018789_49650 [Streptomyces werraensis]